MDSDRKSYSQNLLGVKDSPPPWGHSKHSGVARFLQTPRRKELRQHHGWFLGSLPRRRTRPRTPTSARNSGPPLPVQAGEGNSIPKLLGRPGRTPCPRAPSSRQPGPQSLPTRGPGPRADQLPAPADVGGRRAGASPGFLPPYARRGGIPEAPGELRAAVPAG